MRKRSIVCAVGVVLAALTVMALSRLSPGFADFLLQRCIAPVSGWASSLTGSVGFPLAELVLAAMCALVIGQIVFRRGRGLALLLAVLLFWYAVSWYPLYFAPAAYPYPVEAAASPESLRSLCGELAESIHAFGEAEVPEDARTIAWEAVSSLDLPIHTTASYKAARYPEWLRAAGLAGIYVPWTFEAVVDFSGVDMLFTACHELVHLFGVADEGQANIAAWQACMRAGGAFAYSANLWAMRYALPALREMDTQAWNACVLSLSDTARAHLRRIGAFSAKEDRDDVRQTFFSLNGISDAVGDYDRLIDWLCME